MLTYAVVGANSLVAANRNELATPVLGMDVQIWDEHGHPVRHSGQKGELVIIKPFVSMPVGFWGDEGQEKYRKAYFDTYPGVWTQGDFISQNPKSQGYMIHGRSDGVLNPGGKSVFVNDVVALLINDTKGVRFGTAELYDVVSRFPEVEDALAVGQRRPIDNDEQVLVFIKMKAGGKLDEDLRSKICGSIKASLSPRHVPAFVRQVQDIPYTLNGKKVEHVVKSIVSGEKARTGSSIANPACLHEYERFQNLPIAGSTPKL